MRKWPGGVRPSKRGASLACIALLGFSGCAARADDLIGPYVGAAVGKGRLDVSTSLVNNFGSDNSAFKLIFGWRPISEIAVEIEYLDFGRPHTVSTAPNSSVTLSTDATLRGFAAFGLLYLPTPIVDFYLKGGFSNLHTNAQTLVSCASGHTCAPITQPPRADSTNFGLAGAGGVMYRIRTFELRLEYERFTAGTGNPYLLSFGATWTF